MLHKNPQGRLGLLSASSDAPVFSLSAASVPKMS
jgi:hypothetical protein